MKKETAINFCSDCLDRIHNEGASAFIENPAIQFTADAKAGKFDYLTDKEYNALLDDVNQLSSFWNNKSRMKAGDLLFSLLERVPMTQEQTDAISEALAGQVEPLPDNNETPQAAMRSVLQNAFACRSPKEIRDYISQDVMGQPEAVKAASLITWNHLARRRTNAVFAGPSGCGKSEIWRCLSKEYPGMVRMMDFSRFSAEGWLGSLHLRDIFEGLNPEDIRKNGLIVVLDEADKIVCEHAVGSNGTDYNALLQNDLLKMMDGDVIEFGSENNKKDPMSIDCSNVSIVMLGAFERLLEGKTQDNKQIGFGSSAASEDVGKHKEISYDDLIHAGMRREIAGRINRIVALNPLSADHYKAILKGPVLSGLRQSIKCKITIDRAAVDGLAERAIASGLGVRWMSSALRNAIDDALFDMPDAVSCSLTMRDGELRCRTQRPRKKSCFIEYNCFAEEELPF